ncbi:MAG: hypothetical protein II704_00240 [Erysipelotrichaceae bacterium]|nr:hypothetical protein [Erysipelotrichaceae bacterium]
MLLVGTPRMKELTELVNDRKIEGITFHIESVQGLSAIVSSDTDDAQAKAVMKNLIRSTPVLSRGFSSVQICDEKGRIR